MGSALVTRAASQQVRYQPANKLEVAGCVALAATCFALAYRFVPPVRFRPALVTASLLPSAIWAGVMVLRKAEPSSNPPSSEVAPPSPPAEPLPKPPVRQPPSDAALQMLERIKEAAADKSHVAKAVKGGAMTHPLYRQINTLRQGQIPTLLELRDEPLFAEAFSRLMSHPHSAASVRLLLDKCSNKEQQDVLMQAIPFKVDRQGELLVGVWLKHLGKAEWQRSVEQWATTPERRELAYALVPIDWLEGVELSAETATALSNSPLGSRRLTELTRLGWIAPTLAQLERMDRRAIDWPHLIGMVNQGRFELASPEYRWIVDKAPQDQLTSLEGKWRIRPLEQRRMRLTKTDDIAALSPSLLLDDLKSLFPKLPPQEVWKAIEGWKDLDEELAKLQHYQLYRIYERCGRPERVLDLLLRPCKAYIPSTLRSNWADDATFLDQLARDRYMLLGANGPKGLTEQWELYQKVTDLEARHYLLTGQGTAKIYLPLTKAGAPPAVLSRLDGGIDALSYRETLQILQHASVCETRIPLVDQLTEQYKGNTAYHKRLLADIAKRPPEGGTYTPILDILNLHYKNLDPILRSIRAEQSYDEIERDYRDSLATRARIAGWTSRCAAQMATQRPKELLNLLGESFTWPDGEADAFHDWARQNLKLITAHPDYPDWKGQAELRARFTKQPETVPAAASAPKPLAQDG